MTFVRLVLAVIAVVVAFAVATLMATTAKWHGVTRDQVDRMQATTREVGVFSPASIAGVPPPVARYFRRALHEGQPLPASAVATQDAEFFINGAWRPLKATQHFASSPPAFVWDASIRMAPLMPVHVRDSYLDRRGSMQATMYGVYTLADQEGVPELNAGALQRYLGEAVWFPTALLPGSGVTWTPVDDRAAIATLVDGPNVVSLKFGFDSSDRIIEVSGDRYAENIGSYELRPWLVRCTNHEERSGILIPLSCEVAWLSAAGPQPYWRGRITTIEYTFPGLE